MKTSSASEPDFWRVSTGGAYVVPDAEEVAGGGEGVAFVGVELGYADAVGEGVEVVCC